MSDICTHERFLDDIKNHKMEILLDSGVHRHLKFTNNGSSIYRFDIVTWDGYLAITGDMGCCVFSRLFDMFQFIRTDKDGIDFRYWQEKVVSGRESTERFSYEKLKKLINEYIDSRLDGEGWDEDEIDELKDDIEYELSYYDRNSVRLFDAINEYSYHKNKEYLMSDKPDFEFTNWGEWHGMANTYTFQYIWQCYAIQYAVKEYDKFKENI